MAKKNAKKKNKKKKDNKEKSKKKKILKKKESKKKVLKKKESKKKDQKKKEKNKKKVPPKKKESLKTAAPKQVSPTPVAKILTDRSSNYNVRDGLSKLRSLKTPEDVRAFTKGEKRLTITKNIPAVIRRLS